MRTSSRVLCACILIMASCAQGAMIVVDVSQRSAFRVTIYNNGMGLISDSRPVDLPRGDVDLRFSGVSPSIHKTSLMLVDAQGDPLTGILEQRVISEPLSRAALLKPLLGKEILLVDERGEQDPVKSMMVELIAFEPELIVRYGNSIKINPTGTVTIPASSIEPSSAMHWKRRGPAIKSTLQALYLTDGLSWQADYTLRLAADGTEMDLQGWASLHNRSGMDLPNAKVTLVAGNVRRVSAPARLNSEREETLRFSVASAMQEEPLHDYHQYQVGEPVSISDNRVLQIPLFHVAGVAVERQLVLESVVQLYGREQNFVNGNPSVTLKFSNQDNLARALPAGQIRVYGADGKGELQFLGEDRIQHTPLDGEVLLNIGQAFDVLVERRQTEFTRHNERSSEATYEIDISNRKATDELVSLIESVNGDWAILEESQPHRKIDATRIEYKVSVPAGSDVTLKYRVRSRW